MPAGIDKWAARSVFSVRGAYRIGYEGY